MVFVDKLTKMVHLAWCTKDVTAIDYAKLFVDHVFRLKGLLEVIISNWDPRFFGKFWRSLFDLLSMDLRFSTAFHPQTNGQSERMIQTMENFLRPYVERRPVGWSQHLALAEFAANNVVNVAIGYTPFFINSRDHPIVPLILLHGRDVSSHVKSCADYGRQDEDSPIGSLGQSLHSVQIGQKHIPMHCNEKRSMRLVIRLSLQ